MDTISLDKKKECISNFIVFEGIDGCGKSTQVKKLAKCLHERAYCTAEPTELKTGKFLRSVLRGEIKTHHTTVAHLFAADRSEHLYGKDGILERCHKGQIVLCDRYVFSSLAYQGVTCGSELPTRLNKDFHLPEIVFYFDLSPEESLKRMSGREESEIYEKLDFLQSTHAQYEKVFELYERLIADGLSTMKIVRIDARKTPKEIASIVWSHIEPLVK